MLRNRNRELSLAEKESSKHMDEKPLVSVIIPFLNAEKFFEEAVESVLAQTYTEWELILVDDGSTDKSTHIALEYKNKHPDKISYLQHNQHVNRGISASRNLGIRNAKGVYIATLDADDVWLPNKLEEQVNIMESNSEIGMVYGNTKHWYSWTKNVQDIERDYYMHDRIQEGTLKLNNLISPPTLLILAMEGKIEIASMSNIMLRKDILIYLGGYEDVFNGMHEDQAVLAKFFVNSKVYIANTCWDLYRQHQDSCFHTALASGQKRSREIFFLEWLEKYILAQNINNPYLLKAIRDKKFRYQYPSIYKLSTYKYRIGRRIKNFIDPMLPLSLKSYSLSKLKGPNYIPEIGNVNFGELRRLKPLCESSGSNRGLPVDRYYIENFLQANSNHIKGRVLEIGDNYYTYKYGSDHVTKSDILNIVKEVHTTTTIVADLTSSPQIPSNVFDCIIFTQTLQLIYDLHSAIDTLYRILKPGGVILATLAGISQTDDYNFWEKNWYWRFTSVSAEKLFKEKFPGSNVEIQGYGNVFSAACFLYGLVKEDLKQEELDYYDHKYEILITIKAVKPS